LERSAWWLKKKSKKDQTTTHIILVVLRNVCLHVLLSGWLVWSEMRDIESEFHMYCVSEFDIKPAGLIASNYTLSEFAPQFAEAWKVFHPSNLWLVRLSHAILYPCTLLVIIRQHFNSFLVWYCFSIFADDMLADIVHYVSGPQLADMSDRIIKLKLRAAI
jgi:hypothetical protein